MSLSPSVGARPRALAVLAALFAVASAHAQCPSVIRVPEDAASINAAVAQVCAGTTAEIVVGPGSWTAHVTPVAGASIVVRGTDRANTIIFPGGTGGRFTTVPYGSAVRFVDATLRNGGSGLSEFWVSFERCDVVQCAGIFFPESASVLETQFIDCLAGSPYYGILYLQADTTVARCSFIRCARPLRVWGDGGANGHLIQDCTFQACTDTHITVSSSCCSYGANRARIERCTFDDTTGGSGAAIIFDAFQAAGAQTPVLDIVDCVFRGIGQGTSSSAGGAVRIGARDYTSSMSSTTITGSSFIGCRAGTGGAIYVRKNQPVALSGCTFTGNSATVGSGGALAQEFGGSSQQLSASNCSFVGNTAAGDGGALKLSGWSGIATMSGCSFQSNSASGYGGAVHVDRTQATATNCQFGGNASSGQGGGYFQFMGTTNLDLCSFVANQASQGAALRLYSFNTSQVQSCTFAGNIANSAGAVWITQDCTSAIQGCTFEDNASSGPHALEVDGPGSVVTVTGCAIRSEPSTSGSTPKAIGLTASASLTVSSTSICGSGVPAWTGAVTDGGGNCVVESCADTDGNGIADACQVVSVPGDFGTIQQAIDATAKGEFRIVSVGPGTYAGPIQFNGKAVLVRGAGAGVTILQGTGGARSSVVRFTGGEPITAGLEGITVRGGQTGSPFPGNPAVLVGGGVFGFNSAASIRDCIIEQNASGFGGGAYFWFSTGSIERTVLRLNTASADGGGLQAYGGALRCTDVSIVDNDANSRGGGMHLVEGVPVLTRVSVTSNGSNNIAGGISWVPQGVAASRLVLDACTVTDNVANVSEGGISCVDDSGGAKLDLRGTRVCANVPVPNVAGPYVADASSEVCDCIADITLDGLVNGADLAGLLSAWGTDGGPTPRADCNRDGTVDGSDLGIVLGGWGTCAP